MANKTFVQAVTTTAVALTGARITSGYEQSILVTWLSGQDVYLGGSDVLGSGTTHLGYLINAANPTFQVKTDGPLYAITATSNATVHVFRTFD